MDKQIAAKSEFTRKNGKLGLSDKISDFVLPCKYNLLFLSKSGNIIALSDNELEVYSAKGNLISSKRVLHSSQKRSPTFTITKKGGLLGVKSNQNKVLLYHKYISIEITDFEIYAQTQECTLERYDHYGNLLETVE